MLKMIMFIGMIVSADVLYGQNAEEMVFEKLTLDIPINDAHLQQKFITCNNNLQTMS